MFEGIVGRMGYKLSEPFAGCLSLASRNEEGRGRLLDVGSFADVLFLLSFRLWNTNCVIVS